MHNMFRQHAGLFFLAAFFVSFSAGLGFADFFRVYRSEVLLMVLPQERAVSTREIAENLVVLSETAAYRNAFFDTVDERAGIYDAPIGSDAKKRFQKLLTVSATEQGSVLRVAAHFEDRETSAYIASSAATVLARFAGHYYNVKTEAEFRIIDGPNVSREIRGVALWIFSSIAAGFASTGILFGILLFLPELFSRSRPRSSMKYEKEKTLFRPEVFEPQKFDVAFGDQLHAVADETKEGAERKERVSQEPAPASHSREERSAVETPKRTDIKGAPSNLPVAVTPEEEAFLREFSFEGASTDEEEMPKETTTEPTAREEASSEALSEVVPDNDREPTEEEYKRRLNELLRG